MRQTGALTNVHGQEGVLRHINFSPDALAAEDLVRPQDPKILKKILLSLITRSRAILSKMDPADLGGIFIDSKGNVVKDIDGLDRTKVTRHLGSVRGSWPRIVWFFRVMADFSINYCMHM